MANNVNGFIVVLDHDISEDDLKNTITALSLIKGVIDVQPNCADVGNFIAQSRVRTEIYAKIVNFAVDNVLKDK